MPLTHIQIASAVPSEKDRLMSDGNGLEILVRLAGQKGFQVQILNGNNAQIVYFAKPRELLMFW